MFGDARGFFFESFNARLRDELLDGEIFYSLSEARIVIESWRFSKLFGRVLNKLEHTDASRYTNQLRYFQKKLDESLALTDLRLVNLEGQIFDPGMAATPINIGDFEAEDRLLVDQMMDPILMGPEGIVKSGTILLRKAD